MADPEKWQLAHVTPVSLFSLLFFQRLSINDKQTYSKPPSTRPCPGEEEHIPTLSVLSSLLFFSLLKVISITCCPGVACNDLLSGGLASPFPLSFSHTVTPTLDSKSPCSWPGDLPGSPENICSARIGRVLTVALGLVTIAGHFVFLCLLLPLDSERSGV